MEQNENLSILLAQFEHPAFLVQDGMITEVNPAAQKRLLFVGTEMDTLLETGKKEYRSFTEGQLMLTLKIAETEYQATITRLKGTETVTLMEPEEQPEIMRALALAGMKIRNPLSEIFALANQLLPSLENQEKAQQLNQNLYQLQRIVCNMTDAGNAMTGNPSNAELRNVPVFFEEIFSKAAASLSGTDMQLQFTNLNQNLFSMIDSQLLERGLYNILENAAKFSGRQGTIQAALQQKGNWLRLTVTNPIASGFCVPTSDLFNFYLREPSLEEPRYGIGLGMFMIQAAARSHSGTVLLEQPSEAVMRLTMTMRINRGANPSLRESSRSIVDYAGEMDHCLLELSSVLPPDNYPF